MKKLFIIDQSQFGYHTGNYKYCHYLRHDFDIVYICWDHNLTKIEMPDIKVVYVSRQGDFISRSYRFFRNALKELNDDNAIIFIKYFKIITFALKLCNPSHCFIVDIRTGSIHRNPLRRVVSDTRLRIELLFFQNITVISKSLANRLKIGNKAHILPLGAEILSEKNKRLEHLNLLYVGTLYNRNIDKTIHGFKRFFDEFGKQIKMSYTIIGAGPNNEEVGLKNIVNRYGLENEVFVLGRIPYTRLKPYFDFCNVGISYIPITDYYDVQPPTKTFEYLLSGMPVIATHTAENLKIINAANGILISDKIKDFYCGLKKLSEKKEFFDSAVIRNNCIKYTWENIIINNLKTYLESKFKEHYKQLDFNKLSTFNRNLSIESIENLTNGS